MDACMHEVDPYTVSVSADYAAEGRVVLDVTCRLCGDGGSLSVDTADVLW